MRRRGTRQRVDEDRFAVGTEAYIVNVEIAGDPGEPWYEHGIMGALGGAERQGIVESIELILRGQ